MDAGKSRVGERLAGGPDKRIVELIYADNLRTEFPATFKYIIKINRVHTVGLLEAGIIDRTIAKALLDAFDTMERQGTEGIEVDPSLEESYFNHEAWLIRLVGMEIGGQLHTGRSRNDLGATVDRLRARDQLIDILKAQLSFRRTLSTKASDHADVVMPGYTHMQPAQPVTFGYYLSAIASAAGRDYRRLHAALAGNDYSPLGAAALSGSRYGVNSERTARLLGFSDPFGNGLDAVAARDFLLEAGSAAAIAAGTCGRMAQDFYFMVTDEFSSLEIDDSVSGTSSIMPQKKNPFLLEFLRGSSAQIAAASNASLAGLSGKNYTVAIDTIREDLRGAWRALDKYRTCVELAELAVNAVRPRPDVMLARARGNFATVTDLADTLVLKAGLSFREAHHIVGQIVRMSLERGQAASEIRSDLVSEAALEVIGRRIVLTDEDIVNSLDPVCAVGLRTGRGQTAPDAVRSAIAEIGEGCLRDEEGLAQIEAALERQDQALESAVAEIRSVN